ncbi:MAG: GHKL domain-containing protein [Ruminococcus sp.]|nr:GHKL domain-containing protein [Ruminococcus sp.]MDY3894689.1 GHKL domain-containing protein [Candidatus Fimenecus sp.]
MPPIYRIAEIIIYSLLNFLPFLALALYPFRRSLRFSKKTTGLFIFVLTIIQILLGTWAAFSSKNNAGTISAVSTILYAAFYFLTVKKHFGKTLFTLLMISNIANFAVISAKTAEGLLFPSLATQSYRWSFSLMLFIAEAILAIPLFLYMKKVYTPAVEKEPSGFEWRYLWLIPATFYVMWYYSFYGNTRQTSLEIALNPKNTVYLFTVNVGAILIYYVVTRLILEQNKTLELTERNHRLTMQALQYENLQGKITEARRAKHDVRHHIALMQKYLNDKDYDSLKKYLDGYGMSLPDDSILRFCENTAANAVLLYFAQQAKDNKIDYIVKTDIPENIDIPETDISVMLGNLIKNAVEACKKEKSDDKKVVIRANADGGSLCITVDNTYTGTPKFTNDGNLVSTKHAGLGLGTSSVKSIAARHSGLCRFEVKDGMFYASVLCQMNSR